jgi:hypothetical protein
MTTEMRKGADVLWGFYRYVESKWHCDKPLWCQIETLFDHCDEDVWSLLEIDDHCGEEGPTSDSVVTTEAEFMNVFRFWA